MCLKLVLQTCGGRGDLFFIFQCWQDGLRMMLECLKNRSYDFYGRKSASLPDLRALLGERRVSRLLVDWEALSSWFGDSRTPEQIRESGMNFPSWFVQKLVKHGAIEANSTVK